MTKEEMQNIAHKNNMEIMRDPITREAYGYYLFSEKLIPELDEIADSAEHHNVNGERIRSFDDEPYLYRIICPTSWFDLGGEK